MARPRAGTPAGDLATKRWRETMARKHGSISEMMAGIGRKGGLVTGTQGGFAAEIECECDLIKGKHFIRNCAGAKGGTISKRGPAVV